MHSKWIFIVIFFILASGMLHYWTWKKLCFYLHLQNKKKTWLTSTFLLFYIGTPILKTFSSYYMNHWTALFNTIFLTWLGCVFLVACTLLVFEFSRLFSKVTNLKSSKRRLFLKQSFQYGALATTAGVSTKGIHNVFREPEIKRVPIKIKSLPNNFKGFKIIQITDLHIGPTIRKDFVEKVVEIANSLKPDLVALTGDFVDGQIHELKNDFAPLKNLKSKHGSYFITGNHEYYSGADAWIEHIKNLGITVLRNENIKIKEGDEFIHLAGIDDWGAQYVHETHGPNYETAFEGCKGSETTILLSHQPKGFHKAVKYNVSLQLSGHTHGGQIWPFNFAVGLFQPFVRGLHKVKDSQIYVSCGTGYWGPAMRVGTHSEITQIELT